MRLRFLVLMLSLRVFGRTPEADDRANPVRVSRGDISMSPSPGDLKRVILTHKQLMNALYFMWWEHVDSSSLKDRFPPPTGVEKRADDTLRTSGENSFAHWTMDMNIVSDGVRLTLAVENRSNGTWKDISGGITCFSPRYRPEGISAVPKGFEQSQTPFADRHSRDHTCFVDRQGRLALLTGMGVCFRDAETERAVNADDNWVSAWWNKSYPPDPRYPACGLLVRSKAGWVMALAWNEWVHLKTHDLLDCLHVDPRIGLLAPGQSKELHGRLYLYRGTPDRVLRGCRPDPSSAQRAR